MKYAFLLIFILFLAGNFYVFQRIWLIMPSGNIGRIVLVSIAVFLVASVFINFIFSESLPVPVASFFYTVGTSWMIIFIYVFILTLLKDLIRLIRLVPWDTFSHYTKDNWLALALALGFVIMLMTCGYLKYRWKVRVNLPVNIEKEFTGRNSIRIVAISDLHLGYGIGKSELIRWIKLINSEKPDIVLIAGDIIDNSVRPLDYYGLEKYFKDIQAPLGIYACPGNHEYISGLNESIRFIDSAGITLLKDSSVLVENSFYIVGRDDKTNPRRKPLAKLLSSIDKSKPVILMDHQPYNLEESEANGIDFQFSGHTHDGQVFPITLITNAIYEDPHGFIRKGNTNVYVSSGIGIWGGKFRIGTQSEYVVVDIMGK